MKKLFIVFFLSSLVFILACGGGGFDIYNSARRIAPEIQAAVATASVKLTEDNGFHPAPGALTALAQTFEAYREDQDMEFFYKILWEAGAMYDYANENCETIEKRIVRTPFTPMDMEQTYDCLGSWAEGLYQRGFAIDKTATDGSKFLITYKWEADDDTHPSYGIIQGSRTNDRVLELRSVQLRDGAHRIDVKGNENTNLMEEFKYIGVKDGATDETHIVVNLVGHGYPKGEGNFFLLRAKYVTPNDEHESYFCVPADSTTAEIEALDYYFEEDIDEGFPCQDYLEIVNGMEFLKLEDVPRNFDSDFGGTVFLD